MAAGGFEVKRKQQGSITHRRVRQQQISEAKRLVKRVSFHLHVVFAERNAALCRPVTHTFLLQSECNGKDYSYKSVSLVIINYCNFVTWDKQQISASKSTGTDELFCDCKSVMPRTCSLSLSSVSMTMEWHFHSHTMRQKSCTVCANGPWVAMK